MALHKNKGFTAKQSRRMSASMHANTVGTHVLKRPEMGKHQRMNADSVAFSNSRRQNRAVRGEVNTVYPTSRSNRNPTPRVGQRQYLQDRAQKQRRRNIVKFFAVVVAIVALAIGAGYLTYTTTVSGETALKDSNAKDALVAPKDNSKPYYALITAELGAHTASNDNNGPDVILLTRVDEANKEVTFVPIPADLQVSSNGQTMQIADTVQSGDADLIKAVASFSDVSIAHYYKLSQQNLIDLVNAVGGVEMTLPQVIDDPNAGNIFIPAGTQTLNGEEAIVYQRATNVSNGVDGQLLDQAKFASALIAKMLSGEGTLSLASQVDKLCGYFATDMSSSDLVGLANSLSGMTASDFTVVSVPGYDSTSSSMDGTTEHYYIVSGSEWTKTMSDLDSGNTSAGQTVIETVDPSSFTITVKNGASITGAAASTASLLTSKGFKVEDTGNTDQAIYEETLVIYDGENGRAQAQTVIDAIGMGRAVKGQGYYDYETNILLILGGDYKPTS